MSSPLQAATVAAAVAAAVVAGVFLAFSAAVMPALERQPGTQGMTAMQEVNRVIVRGPFMVFFAGGALLCAVLAVVAVVRWGRPGSPWLLAGSLATLVGSFGLTAAYHVPRNDRLATIAPDAAGAAARWADYAAGWTAWNHVRALAALASAVLLTVALLSAD